ncbi:hypothetical protein TRFO_24347 [Tritrichomonas foetus]|uniref:GRAM domain-containing protein n=1 Tax=Tritrichomonas foetus TaxID=1144522 RepID=A0A1J4K981_9EUKA|nr:hypothetical protein TRFO_24347 [Tritrichomonas foetus]|eukprot:OHT07448.1 hypothetical protein TRFO_24347 [Tritrichomonas foetus]
MKSSTSIENPDSLHTLSKFKLKPLLPSLWSKLEELLVSLNVEYFLDNSLKEKKIKKIKKHGFLLVTFGAIYIFKKNLLTESALKYRVSYLDIKKVEVYEGKYFSLFFENEDYLRVYSKKSQQICEVLSKII